MNKEKKERRRVNIGLDYFLLFYFLFKEEEEERL